MHTYIHKVHYYETDKMGIVHHSNYIRWMEEARVDYLAKAGLPYDKLEREGVISPVVSLECSYKTPSRFGDTVEIRAQVKSYKGVRLVIGYEMKKEGTGEICCLATSTHCFTDSGGRPVALRRTNPELDEKLRGLLAAEPDVKEEENGKEIQ